MQSSRRIAALLLVFGVTVSVIALFADEPATSRTLLLSMAMNAKQVVQYEWKQRITVIRRGKPSDPIVDQIRFDSGGQMQRTTISAPEQKQMGGIRGRIAAGVKEDVKGIMQLAGEYNKPQQMAAAMKKAQITPAPGGNALQVQASGLIQPTDSMTMLVNSATHLATHVDINTSYEGSPMTIAQDYAPIPAGPNMMKRMKVSVPQKNLMVDIDSYGYTRQSASLRR
jgi:hypothetical protein